MSSIAMAVVLVGGLGAGTILLAREVGWCWRLIFGLLSLAIIVPLVIAFAEAGQDTMRNCPAEDRWAISVWDGPGGVEVGEALEICDSVEAVYSLDPETQAWQRWFPERPELSTLETLDALQGVFALGGEVLVVPAVTATPEKTAASTPAQSATPTVVVTPTAIPTATPSPTAAPTPVPSATPTPTATPTQTSVPGPTLQFFSGDGDGSVEPFPLWQGWAVFSFTYEGMFYVGLYDSAGVQLEWFRGGEKRVTIPVAAAYTMEVQAQRPWTITVRQ